MVEGPFTSVTTHGCRDLRTVPATPSASGKRCPRIRFPVGPLTAATTSSCASASWRRTQLASVPAESEAYAATRHRSSSRSRKDARASPAGRRSAEVPGVRSHDACIVTGAGRNTHERRAPRRRCRNGALLNDGAFGPAPTSCGYAASSLWILLGNGRVDRGLRIARKTREGRRQPEDVPGLPLHWSRHDHLAAMTTRSTSPWLAADFRSS